MIVKYYKKSGKWYYAEWRTDKKIVDGEVKTEKIGWKKVTQGIRYAPSAVVGDRGTSLYYFGKNGAKVTKKGWYRVSSFTGTVDIKKAYVNKDDVYELSVTHYKDENGNKLGALGNDDFSIGSPEELIIAEDDAITMPDGVVLNLSCFPETRTLSFEGDIYDRYVREEDGTYFIDRPDESWYDLGIYADRSIGSTDITYVFNDGNAQFVWDESSVPSMYPNGTTTFIYHYTDSPGSTSGYYIPSWENKIAYVEPCYEETEETYHSYVAICAMETTGTFTISAYYKGTFLRTCTVTLTTTGDTAMIWRNEVTEIESKAWTESTLVAEKKKAESYHEKGRAYYSFYKDQISEEDLEKLIKMRLLRDYVEENYPYSKFDCTRGSTILLYAANDLGLQAVYRNSFNPQGHAFFCLDGNNVAGGHVYISVTIGGGKLYLIVKEGRATK